MRNERSIGFGLLLIAAGFSAPAAAATLLAVDLAELVRMSEHVVVAKAETRTSREAVDTGLIVTDVRLRVLTALKGDAKVGDTLVATLLGGTIGDLGLSVPGEATLPADRSAIVFLRRNELGELRVSGMSQGVLPIVGQGKSALVTPGGAGAELVHTDSHGTLRDAADARMQPQSLSSLLAEIRRLAAAQVSGP